MNDNQFKELQLKAIQIWKTYDDEYGYASEKIAQVNSIRNFKDNFITIYGMFDTVNQQILLSMLSDETEKALMDGYYK